MSNRTAEASKAIREAWEREKTLVKNGQGTRNWTPSQQKDIIEKGKAYDEDGKAFEGHHMKSAEKYPQYQGDADNIQFLSRTEHKDAHNGDFHNPTNGYYDSNTKVTSDFGDNKYTPCIPIQLTNPQYKKITNRESNGLTTSINNTFSSSTNIYKTNYKNGNQSIYSQHPKKQENKGLINKIKILSEAHPIITELVKTVGKIGIKTIQDKVTNNYINKPTNKPRKMTLERNNSQSNSDNSELEPVSNPDSTKIGNPFFRNGGKRKSHLRHYSNGKIITVKEATVKPTIVNAESKEKKE